MPASNPSNSSSSRAKVRSRGNPTLLACGILTCVSALAGPPPVIPWTAAASFGGTGVDIGGAVKVDRAGNRYVTGSFSASALFPGRALADPRQSPGASSPSAVLTSAGSTDAFLAKYDRAGNLKWIVKAGGGGEDHGIDLAIDGTGNIYLTGVFANSATFQGLNGSSESVTGTPNTIFLAKYTPTGVLSWVQTGLAPYGANAGYGVAVDPLTSSVYITGVTQGDTTFSSADGTSHAVFGPFTWHMFLTKFDFSGNFKWGQANQASPNSVANKVAVDVDANIYVTGWMESLTTFHSNDGNDKTIQGISGPVQSGPDFPDDVFLVEYDENGNLQWIDDIGGYKAIAVDVASSRDGRISITGFVGNIAGTSQQAQTIVSSQPGGSSVNLGGGMLTRPFNKDLFFATYDENGVLLEARRFGGPLDEGGTGVAYDRHGNLTLAGLFNNTLAIGGQTLVGKTPLNLVVATFSQSLQVCTPTPNSSKLAWAHTAGGMYVPSYETGPRLGLSPDGDALVTGEFQSTSQFGDFTTLHSAGGTDGFMALLEAP